MGSSEMNAAKLLSSTDEAYVLLVGTRSEITSLDGNSANDGYNLFVNNKGKSLDDLIKSEAQKSTNSLCDYRDDGTAYAISDLYVTCLRVLLNAIKMSQESQSNVTVSLDLKDIFIAGDMSPRCVLTKYVSRDACKRTCNDDLVELAKTLQYVNRILWLEPDPSYQMNSFIFKILRNTESEQMDLNEVLEHPILWQWRRRKDFIIDLAGYISLKKIKSLHDSEVVIAFKDWEDILEANENLKLLKQQQNSFKEGRRPAQENIEGRRTPTVGNKQKDEAKKIIECIVLMRDTYCHFFEKKSDIGEDFKIEKPKEVEKYFYQNFPKLIYALADKAARLKKQDSDPILRGNVVGGGHKKFNDILNINQELDADKPSTSSNYRPQDLISEPTHNLSQRYYKGEVGDSSKVIREWWDRLPKNCKGHIIEAGFSNFLEHVVNIDVDMMVLDALAGKWQDTTNTFRFPFGEVTLTPLDFSMITGIVVGGEKIPWDSDMHRKPQLIEKWLGWQPKVLKGGLVNVNDIWQEFHNKECLDTTAEEQLTRAFMMFIFGETLFANGSGTINLWYLEALKDVSKFGQYNWGGAAMAVLYRHMCTLSNGLKKGLSGFNVVWEIWAYEVLGLFPPSLVSAKQNIFPRMGNWRKRDHNVQPSANNITNFCSAFNINWRPWKEVEHSIEKSATLAKRHMILEGPFDCVYYLGERVARQVLEVDNINPPKSPPKDMLFIDPISIENKYKGLWMGKFCNKIEKVLENTGDSMASSSSTREGKETTTSTSPLTSNVLMMQENSTNQLEEFALPSSALDRTGAKLKDISLGRLEKDMTGATVPVNVRQGQRQWWKRLKATVVGRLPWRRRRRINQLRESPHDIA